MAAAAVVDADEASAESFLTGVVASVVDEPSTLAKDEDTPKDS